MVGSDATTTAANGGDAATNAKILWALVPGIPGHIWRRPSTPEHPRLRKWNPAVRIPPRADGDTQECGVSWLGGRGPWDSAWDLQVCLP